MEAKLQNFDGSGDVNIFIEKISLRSALKGFEGEKAAQNLTCHLKGRAFDVYLRLSEADKKDPSKIQEELKREFEKGNQDRELAVHELSNRKRFCDESAQTFAYKIEQLVKLAYPSFNDEARQTIARDYFVKGLHHEMQIALKSSPQFSTASLIDLAKETSRLQIAGIQSVASSKQGYCMSVETNHDVDSVVDKVLEKIKGLTVGIPEGAQAPPSVEFVDNKPVGRFSNRERGPYRSRPRSFRGGYQPTTSKTRRCRACQSADHSVRECPMRFCQACGNKGHDSWDKSCPKYL